MTGNSTRLASTNSYESALHQLTARQSQLSKIQEQMSAGKRVLRPSDDPTAAAQAERASTRLSRVATDQRALEVQRNAITTGEATLGHASNAMQDFRALLVQAGNSALSAVDRASIAQQLSSLRDQILGFANSSDSNGLPLFAGLGSTAQPFVDPASGVVFDGIAGQPAAGALALPAALDGHATWMDVPTGNGVFVVTQAAGTAAVYSDVGKVVDPSALTGHDYRIQFGPSGSAMAYDVIDTTTGTTILSAQPFQPDKPIVFDGIALVVGGEPAAGEALQITPSTKTSLFGVLDQAIAGVRDAAGGATLAHGIAQALVQVDAGMARLSSARGRAGELLNRADNISDRQSARSVQLESDRSRAEDLDIVAALSEFQNQQAAYSAALGSYAQIQKLSLFNFIS
ncbi:MAG: flagellar hook-associated protein FlgL [Burkholderiales bacterium]